VWNYINNRRKTRTGISQLKRPDGTTTQSDAEAAEVLNDQYFQTFTTEDLSNFPDFQPKNLLTGPLNDFLIQEDKVIKALKALKVDKAAGMDGMHPRVLQELADTLGRPLTLVFRASITTGTLPRQWKDANVSPIFKKGNRQQAANYRLVSLTSIICKTLERIVVSQIIAHLETNSLLCAEQHGFCRGRSTVTNLLEALNTWTEALMHSIPVDVIYLDYAKAFDTVPHERLIHQVGSFGIGGHALAWIKDFLTGRRQQVKINNSTSSWKPVLSGVPQGSVLGPTLFAMFVADVPGKVRSLISMFADDTKMYAPLTDPTSTEKLNKDLSKLQNWSIKMQMKFHPDKCKVMHLGSNNPKSKYTITKESGEVHTLAEADVEKDLGVQIDNNLKFSTHISSSVSKANRVLWCVKRTFKHLTPNIFNQLYKSLVRPHLEYASWVWAPHLKSDMDAIERVQRKATKLVTKIRDLSYEERLRQLDLPTTHFRRRRSDLIQTYKITNGIDLINQDTRCLRCPSKQMLPPAIAQNTRGHDLKLQKQWATGPRARFFATRVVEDWNQLSQSTVPAKSVNHFRAGLRKDWTADSLWVNIVLLR